MNITIVALGSSGDAYPPLALGLGLKKAGCRVCLAANPVFKTDVLKQGIDFFPIQTMLRQSLSDTPGSIKPSKPLNPLHFFRSKKKHIAPILERIVTDIGHACQDADLILYNMLALPAHHFAKQTGTKAFPICLQPLGRTNVFPSPVISSNIHVPKMLNAASYRIVEKCMALFLNNSDQLKGKASFQEFFQEVYSENIPVLHGFSSCILPKPSDWSDNMHITGYWFMDPPRDWVPPKDLQAFLSQGPAPVCVGFGSMNDPDIATIIEKTVQGIRLAGHRVLLLTGWSETPFDETACPDLYVAKSIPHSWLFPKVSAVVHHGGAGTTGAAVRAGIPSIIIPFFFDQGFWADRLEKLEAGPPRLSKKALTQQTMATAINKTLNNKIMRNRLDKLRARLNAENGVENAVNLLLTAMG
jgi:UDP:flavonoid glycosyltransferase YjiC (YdhE family)